MSKFWEKTELLQMKPEDTRQNTGKQFTRYL